MSVSLDGSLTEVESARLAECGFHETFSFLLHPHTYKVAWGGRGGIKSCSFARSLVFLGTRKTL